MAALGPVFWIPPSPFATAQSSPEETPAAGTFEEIFVPAIAASGIHTFTLTPKKAISAIEIQLKP